MATQYDLSDIGGSVATGNIPVAPPMHDLSDLGGQKIVANSSPAVLASYPVQGTSSNSSTSNNSSSNIPDIFSSNNNIDNIPSRNIISNNLSAHDINPSQSDELARNLLSYGPNLISPELSMGTSALARFAVNPAMNALARIGLGTTGSLIANSNNINNMQDLEDQAKQGATFNTLLEGLTVPFRAAGTAAEIFNPKQYTSQKIDQIQNEYSNAVDAQKEAYKYPQEQYGSDNVTFDPKNYLNVSPDDYQYFSPNVKRYYKSFLDDPTFDNLHKLQSRAGMDAAKSTDLNQSQVLTNLRSDITDNKIPSFLSQDPQALAQYKLGSDITRDQVKPYEANKTLKGIVNGKINSLSPQELAGAISSGSQKMVGGIPSNHPLMNHLRDLGTAINIGNAAKFVPELAGAVGGEVANPGASGAIAGAYLAKMLTPGATHFVQNPAINSLVNNYLSPAYYGLGRAGIGYMGNNALNQHNSNGQ